MQTFPYTSKLKWKWNWQASLTKHTEQSSWAVLSIRDVFKMFKILKKKITSSWKKLEFIIKILYCSWKLKIVRRTTGVKSIFLYLYLYISNLLYRLYLLYLLYLQYHQYRQYIQYLIIFSLLSIRGLFMTVWNIKEENNDYVICILIGYKNLLKPYQHLYKYTM